MINTAPQKSNRDATALAHPLNGHLVGSRLQSLLVSDVMSPVVVDVSAHATMSDAAHTLSEHKVTGAPVVNETGRCVGVISMSDFGRSVPPENRAETAFRDRVHRLVPPSFDEPWTIDAVRDHLVTEHMSRDVYCIPQYGKLIEAARRMCTHHVHRLVVVNKHGHPIGVLTSLDIAASVVAVVDESHVSWDEIVGAARALLSRQRRPEN